MKMKNKRHKKGIIKRVYKFEDYKNVKMMLKECNQLI